MTVSGNHLPHSRHSKTSLFGSTPTHAFHSLTVIATSRLRPCLPGLGPLKLSTTTWSRRASTRTPWSIAQACISATMSQSAQRPDYLRALSPAQYAAATQPVTGALSISAPPGSGKTRVLTSRVAWLVREQKIMPEELIVVTFTNKAAREMKTRLHKLIGEERTSRLSLGALPSCRPQRCLTFRTHRYPYHHPLRHFSCSMCKVLAAQWQIDRPGQQLLDHGCRRLP